MHRKIGVLSWALSGGLLGGCAVAGPPRVAAPAQDHAQHALVEKLLAPSVSPKAALTLVFVIDGLRPDAITPEDTPNLHALRTGGVSFARSHSVFPTVTRVNASALVTGRYPAASGIIGNVIYAPEVDAAHAISTGEYPQLVKLDRASGGRLLLAESLGEVLARNGKKLAVVSSSGNGCAFLLNHRAPGGAGVLINGFLDPGKTVAFPSAVNDAVLARFGPTPLRDELGPGATDWAESVLRDYVLPELKPDVVLNWITQPDGAQHAHGAHSAEARAVIRNDDRNIGLVLDKLRSLGLYDRTNILVLSDHGFSTIDHIANLSEVLVQARLKEGPDSTDVVVAGTSIHVRGHDRARTRAILEHLQQQPWVDALFTHAREGAGAREDEPYGFVEGTFSLTLIHDEQAERGADIVVSFPWSSAPNRHGARGIEGRDSYGAEHTGPASGDKASHGNLSPWDVHNTWIAWGVDFKDSLESQVPVANVDLFPTVLALLGLSPHPTDGRIVAEALEGGPDGEKLPGETHTYVTTSGKGGYRAAIQVSTVGRYRYIDKAWRLDAASE